jgi:hypothetical protein
MYRFSHLFRPSVSRSTTSVLSAFQPILISYAIYPGALRQCDCRNQHDFALPPLVPALNRLPLPSPILLDDIAQAWKGEVKGNHQGVLGSGPFEKSAPGGHNLLRSKVDDRIPVWLFYMDGMEHRIGDAQ